MNILFDVDDTLIVQQNHEDFPNHPIVETLVALAKNGHSCYVASGGGIPYAQQWVRRLNLEDYVTAVVPKYVKLPFLIDLSFDDQSVEFGRVNCQVANRRKE